MKITCEAETDAEREAYPEPLVWISVRWFGIAGMGLPGPFCRCYGPWPDVKAELVRLEERVRAELDGRHQPKP